MNLKNTTQAERQGKSKVSTPIYAKAAKIPRPVTFYIFNLWEYIKRNLIGNIVYLFLDDNAKLRVIIEPIAIPSNKHQNTKYKTAIVLRIGGYWKKSQVFGQNHKLWRITDDWDWSFRLIDNLGNSLVVNDIKSALILINKHKNLATALENAKQDAYSEKMRISAQQTTVIENLETQLSRRTFELEKIQKELAQLQLKQLDALKNKDEDLVRENKTLKEKLAISESSLEQARAEMAEQESTIQAFHATISKKNIQLKEAWVKHQDKEKILEAEKQTLNSMLLASNDKLQAIYDFVQNGKKTKLKTSILELLQ